MALLEWSSILPRHSIIMKVYGPYKHSENGRNYVIIHKDGRIKSTAYARHLMEQNLGRELTEEETVDHIDNDKTNDVISNLQILTVADNIRKSAKKTEMYDFICPLCFTLATKKLRQVKHNWNKGKDGPFCGRTCGSRYGRLKQLGRVVELEDRLDSKSSVREGVRVRISPRPPS